MAEEAANLAWIRKYRPTSFDDYLGDKTKELVANRFGDQNTMPQTIMLYGTRGTGKTSMARLLCKEIHCMNKINGHACETCEMCQMINEYISATEAGNDCPGIVEIDAATTTGKEGINDIITDVLTPPMYPLKFKVLILDECHMLSVAAQNSLLKIIEEPPKFLIFILCTTDPEKVIQTIQSRIQLKLEVRKKSVDELADKLYWIGEQEKLSISKEACKLIAKKADRIPREAINLLETVAKNYGTVQISNVIAAIDDVNTEVYLKYFQVANSSLEEVLQFNSLLKEKNIDTRKFMVGLIRFVLDCMYIKYGISMEDYDTDFLETAKELFDIYSSNDLDAMLQVVEACTNQLSTDETRNELLVTTTALRIGKIKLLATGLAHEDSKANNENRRSLSEYQKQLKESQAEMGQNGATYEPTKQAFINLFNNVSTVNNDVGAVASDGKGKQGPSEPSVTGASEPSVPEPHTSSDNSEYFSIEEIMALGES